MKSFWLTMIIVGILTFGIRLSFIIILDRWETPLILQRALRFVPIAVLTAIITPELVMPEGYVDVSLTNLRLLAGIVAMLVAWKTKNIVWTIVAGMGVLLGLLYFL